MKPSHHFTIIKLPWNLIAYSSQSFPTSQQATLANHTCIEISIQLVAIKLTLPLLRYPEYHRKLHRNKGLLCTPLHLEETLTLQKECPSSSSFSHRNKIIIAHKFGCYKFNMVQKWRIAWVGLLHNINIIYHFHHLTE